MPNPPDLPPPDLPDLPTLPDLAISSRSEVTYVKSANSNLTAIRIEGPSPSVKYRCEALKNLLKKFGEIEELHTQNSIELWREIRDVRFLKSEKNRAIWRVSTPPASGAKFTSNILKKYKMEPVYDWGGGLIWLSIDDPLEDHQTLIHSTIKQTGGALCYAGQLFFLSLQLSPDF